MSRETGSEVESEEAKRVRVEQIKSVGGGAGSSD